MMGFAEGAGWASAVCMLLLFGFWVGTQAERQEHRCIPTVCPALSDYTLTLPVYTDRDRWLNDLDACLDEMGRE